METKITSTYTILTLEYLEENLYKIIRKKQATKKKEFIISWKRYLDDCFIFWKCSLGSFNNLYYLFQNQHSKIKFTINTILNKYHFYTSSLTAKMTKSL